jgi:penicillin-binding protein 1A
MVSRLGSSIRRWWRTPKVRNALLISVLALGGFGLAVGVGAWTRACLNGACPSIAVLSEYDPDQAAKVYAADGRHVTDLGLTRRTVIALEEMSPAIIAAFLAVEDKRFYQHNGVDWRRVPGAVWANIRAMMGSGRRQGFSSITMQLAGNIWSEEIDRRQRRGIAGITRKIREMRVALDIERNYSKDKILELYLNQVELGNRAFGVEAASQRYFGKSARDVNVAEAAMLAAVVNAPTLYNPRRNPGFAVRRRNTVINLLRDQGKLTPTSAEAWKAFPVRLSSRSDYTGVADYFVEYVRQILQARFGMELYRAGYRVYTTLDLDIQQSAERALEQQLQFIETGGLGRFPHRTFAAYMEARDAGDDANSPYLQGAVVTMEARTGAILAMVGGRDFDDSKFNRATQANRQAGSTFKPFVYSAALRAGMTLSRIVDDSPLSLEIPDQEPWEPQNFDGRFLGVMSIREALYRSQNIPAARIGLEIGAEAIIGEAAAFGFSTRIPRVPSISLGAAEVIPLEMVAAYSAFANMGTRVTPNPIDRVEDRDGNIIWQPRAEQVSVMDPAHAWLMLDAMRDVVRRPGGTAHGAIMVRGGFTIPAAGKTGTTNDYHDVWYLGFTPDIVTGVWMGFDQPRRIKDNAQGGLMSAPVWATMMREVYERRRAPAAWTMPPGVVAAEIDRATGFLAAPTCPSENRALEWYLPGTEPFLRCPLHTRDLFP